LGLAEVEQASPLVSALSLHKFGRSFLKFTATIQPDNLLYFYAANCSNFIVCLSER